MLVKGATGLCSLCSITVLVAVYCTVMIDLTPIILKSIHIILGQWGIHQYRTDIFNWEKSWGDIYMTTPSFDVSLHNTKITSSYRSWVSAMCICCVMRMSQGYVYLYPCSTNLAELIIPKLIMSKSQATSCHKRTFIQMAILLQQLHWRL